MLKYTYVKVYKCTNTLIHKFIKTFIKTFKERFKERFKNLNQLVFLLSEKVRDCAFCYVLVFQVRQELFLVYHFGL